MVNGLIGFLRVQLDADERRAHELHAKTCGHDNVGADAACDCDWHISHVIGHIKANRAVVAWCEEVIGGRDLSNYEQLGSLAHDKDALAVTLAVETLRLLALPHAGHPSYRPEWRP